MEKPLRATLNCDMGEGFSLYSIADDEALMKTIHLANVACGFHASDFSIMNKSVALAKVNNVHVGAHPGLPDLQGFGRREMSIEPQELASCLIYQVGALSGFLKLHGLCFNHIKPHGALYMQTSRSLPLARAVIGVIKLFSQEQDKPISLIGLPGTAHQTSAEEAGVKFIPEWFADLEYSPEGNLIITRKHSPVLLNRVREKVHRLLSYRQITTVNDSHLLLGNNFTEVTICVHCDTPDAVEIARVIKDIVDESNRNAGYDLDST